MPDAVWKTMNQILCIRLDSMGDVIMTTPALHAIKETLPGCGITLLTSPAGIQVGKLIPYVDHLVEYQAPWMKSTPKRAGSEQDHKMISLLRQGNFDAAVIFAVFSQNPLPAAMMCYLADIPVRLAYCRENPYQLLTHWIKDPDPEQGIRHEVQRQLDLVGEAGFLTSDDRMTVRVKEKDKFSALMKITQKGVDISKPWIVVHPGASAPSRRYPPEYFALACQQLTQEDHIQIVFTGSAEESELIDQIQAIISGDTISLAGQLSLNELAGLLSLANLLISNNTGPAHLAAGVECPVVDLYALTNPQHTPWKTPSRVLSYDVPCKFCYRSICPMEHHRCLRMVAPTQVREAVIELLDETSDRLILEKKIADTD